MISLKEYITSLLPPYIKDQDSYKDVNEKGFVERYIEIFGLELDEHYYPKIYEVEKEFSPLDTTNPAFLDYFGFTLGDWPRFSITEAGYRRFLSYVVSIFKIKGTIKSFYAILYPLGVQIESFTEIPLVTVAYDAGFDYDEAEVNYDEVCQTCSYYDLSVSSLDDLSAQLYQKILDAISLVEPINARLRNFEFNGDVIEEVIISVEVDEFGDLIYNNDADPGLVLTLSIDGDLIISGPNAGRYYLNSEGDLIYIAAS